MLPKLLNIGVNYFDLQFGRRPVAATPQKGRPKADLPVLPQYLALAAGVGVQPFLTHYIEARVWDVSLAAAISQIVFGLLMAICIFPAVYKNAFDRSKPLFVQLCAIFTSGMGWESLFKTAVAAGGKAVGIHG